MYNSIKEVYDEVCEHVVIDHELLHKVIDLESNFVNKKQEHIEFFGGNLTGVHIVRFTDSDRDKLFSEVLDIDYQELENKIYSIPYVKNEKGVNREWHISSDVFNITCVWLIYKFEHSTSLDANAKHHGQVIICCYLYYKFLTSLLYQYFRYPADPEVAQATYAALSNKFSLKVYGSWGATLFNLAENAVNKSRNPTEKDIDETGHLTQETNHRAVIEFFEDKNIIKFLNDTQGSIRSMLKNIYSVLDRINREGVKIKSTTAVVKDVEGESVLRENLRSPGIYNRYIKSIISDRNTFIKQELLDVVCNTMHTVSPRLLLKTLEWVSENYLKNTDTGIDKAIDLILEHAIDYLSVNHSDAKKDLSLLIDKLRGAYMSSRSSDVRLLEARALIEDLVKKATSSVNEAGIAAIRTSFMLYIVSRAYSKRFYSNKLKD